jgi:hypothetical protein
VDYTALLKNYLAEGLDLQAALELLRNDGASPVEAVAAIRDAAGMDQFRAQQAFELSPAWSRPRSAAASRARGPAAEQGQHGRSGHGASSVLPHLLRQPPARTR